MTCGRANGPIHADGRLVAGELILGNLQPRRRVVASLDSDDA